MANDYLKKFAPVATHLSSPTSATKSAISGLMHCSKKASSRTEFWVCSPAQARSALQAPAGQGGFLTQLAHQSGGLLVTFR